MTFRSAVEGTPGLEQSWRSGFQALKPADKSHIKATDPTRIKGSVDLDSALASLHANANRWDYAIGYAPEKSTEHCVFWIEIHPARLSEIKVIIAKLEWLKQWLRESAPKLNSLRKTYVWISSGKTSFTLSSPQRKRLALAGLQHKGRVFTIPKRKAFRRSREAADSRRSRWLVRCLPEDQFRLRPVPR